MFHSLQTVICSEMSRTLRGSQFFLGKELICHDSRRSMGITLHCSQNSLAKVVEIRHEFLKAQDISMTNRENVLLIYGWSVCNFIYEVLISQGLNTLNLI